MVGFPAVATPSTRSTTTCAPGGSGGWSRRRLVVLCALGDHPALGRSVKQHPSTGRVSIDWAKVAAEARLEGKYLLVTDALLVAQEDLFTPRILAGHRVRQNLDANEVTPSDVIQDANICALSSSYRSSPSSCRATSTKAAAITTPNGSDNSGHPTRSAAESTPGQRVWRELRVPPRRPVPLVSGQPQLHAHRCHGTHHQRRDWAATQLGAAEISRDTWARPGTRSTPKDHVLLN